MHYLDNDLELVGGLPSLFSAQTSEMQQLEEQITELRKSIESSKTELLANFNRVSVEQRQKHIEETRNSYKQLRELASQKYKLSSDLELLMDRVNHKVKSDVEAFTHELEFENPGCTFELKKRFVEQFENAGRKSSGRDARKRDGAHGVQRKTASSAGRPSIAGDASQRGGERRQRRGRPPTSSLQLYVNTNTTRGVNGRGDESLASPYWISPVSEGGPTASTSRRSTPANVSPVTRVPYSANWNTSNARPVAATAYSGYSTPIGGGEFLGDTLQTSPRLAMGGGAMPAFASLHESQRGRPRKLTTRVKQMLTEQQKTPRPPLSVGYMQQPSHHSHHHHHSHHLQHMSPLSTQSYSGRGTGGASRRGKSARRRGRPRLHRAADDESRDAYTTDDYTEQDSRDASEFMDADDVESPVDETTAGGEDDQHWCFCRLQSYGDMICCDNQLCDRQWFHFGCVGISAMPPKGEKWFCPSCRGVDSTTMDHVY